MNRSEDGWGRPLKPRLTYTSFMAPFAAPLAAPLLGSLAVPLLAEAGIMDGIRRYSSFAPGRPRAGMFRSLSGVMAGLIGLAVLFSGRDASAQPPLVFPEPMALNTNAASDSGADVDPQVTTDGQGNWVAVWASDDSLGGTIGTDEDILVSRSTDDGATWTPPVALNANASNSVNDNNPQVSTDGLGNWVAVWQSLDPLGPTIGLDADILVARSTDNGATWSAPAALNSNAASDLESEHDRRPQVTTDGLGNWVAVWGSDESLGGTDDDTDILVSRSTDSGATWSASAALNTNALTDGGSDHDAQVATDGLGNWVAVWRSLDSLGGTIGTDGDILVSRSTDNGATWTPPAALNSSAASDDRPDSEPQFTTDGLGNWVAVWNSSNAFGGTIGTDRDIFVARSTDNGATWTPLTFLNTNAASDSDNDWSPQVTTDGVGKWVVVWWTSELFGAPDDDILVAHSFDSGATWSDPASLKANAGWDSEDGLYPQITTDGLGAWLAVWSTTETLGATIGTDEDILVATGAFLLRVGRLGWLLYK